MNRFALTIAAMLAAAPVIAQEHREAAGEEHRELGAHEHGVGRLDVAVEGNRIAATLEVPGADITGFEHAAESEADRAAVAAAIALLEKPLELFVLPQAARCEVVEAHAALAGDHHHDADGDDDKHDGEAAHEGEHGHDHGDDDHAEKGHDGHDDDDDHNHAHSEFRADYVVTCADPAQLTQVEFAYFSHFENAREVELRLLLESGAKAFEVTREAPVLDLRGQF